MKKITILFLFVLLLVGCNPTGTDNERPGAIKLNGDSTITITVGETWTDPGAYVDGDSSIEVTVGGTVIASTAGRYELTYSYVVDEVTISTKRIVIVETEEVEVLGDVILNGDATITITEGDTFTDPGAYVDGDNTITVTVTGTVDIHIPATYTITYAYEKNSETKSATRTVVVEEEEVIVAITCTLTAPIDVTMIVDGTYSEPGYTCNPSTTVVTIDNSDLNVTTAGDYEITYTYSDGERNVVLTRTVTVEEEEDIEFNLTGEQSITIDQNSIWIDPGYTITPSGTTVIVDDPVDTSVPGTYNIEYGYFDGESNQIITRNVTVLRTVYFDYDTYELTGDTLTVDITGIDSDVKYWDFKLELYKDDVFVESLVIINGVNSLEFLNVIEGHTYTLKVHGDYYDGPNLAFDEELIETIVRAVTITEPTISVSNEATTTSTTSYDYLISDPDTRFISLIVKIYDGDTLVDTITINSSDQGDLEFTGLDDYKNYTIKAYISFTNGADETETKLVNTTSTTTELNFSATSSVENASIEIDESNKLIITVQNPNSYTISNLYIDNVDTTFTIVNSTTLEVVLDTSVVGDYTETLNKIVIDVRGSSVDCEVNEEYSYEVTAVPVVEPLYPDIIDFFYTAEYDDTSFTIQYNEFTVVFANFYDFDITNAGIKSTLSNPALITYDDNESITTRQTSYQIDYSGVYEIAVDDGFEEVNNINKLYAYLPVCESAIINVSTVAEVQTMLVNGNGCYRLMNDIDVTSIYFHGAALINHTTSNLILFGDGYTLSNINLLGTREVDNIVDYAGLFGILEDSYIKDLNISFNNSLSKTANYQVFTGGLAGEMDNVYLRNINITGTFNATSPGAGLYGAVAGKITDSFMVDVNVNVSFDLEGTGINIGGITAWAANTTMNAVSSDGDIDLTTIGTLTGNVGGLVGRLQNSKIYNSYNVSNIDTRSLNVGGIVGTIDWESILFRVYNDVNVINVGTNTGGIVGNNESGPVRNAVNTGNVYGGSTDTGLIYGLDSGSSEYTDVYYSSAALAYNEQVEIIASDASNANLTAKTSVEIETREFFEETLNYSEYWYDLSQFNTFGCPPFK